MCEGGEGLRAVNRVDSEWEVRVCVMDKVSVMSFKTHR